jgi:hypothetical protein
MLYVSQKLKVYMLTIYFIDEKCVDITQVIICDKKLIVISLM